MQAERYFGTYARFETKSKKEAGALLGADNLVGDRFSIVFETVEGVQVAWLENRFGGRIGYLDAALSRTLSIYAARGWNMQAELAFVAYTDIPDPGYYWGQAVVACYDPSIPEPMEAFLQGIGARLADGIRPEVDLGDQAVTEIVAANGAWQPKKTVPLPEREHSTVIMKDRRKMSEKVIEQGREGNKGCYIVSWAFIIALVVLVAFGLKTLLL